jgi:hypothetical protein
MRQILSNSIVCLLLAGGISAQTTPEIGAPAPDFELRDSSGTTHRLSDYRGNKAVVLEFFRSGDW